MKLIRDKINSKKLTELSLIKARTYENTSKKSKLINTKLNKLISSFKKAVLLIFKYNKKNKNILFIGIPKTIEQKINLETRHLSLPNSTNIQNFDVSKLIIKGIKLKHKLLKDNKLNINKTINKPDLIVLFDKTHNETVINEGYSAKIPLIVFGINENEILHLKHDYNVTGNNSNKSNVFFILLNSILKLSKS